MTAEDPNERPTISECLKDEIFKFDKEEDIAKQSEMFKNMIQFKVPVR